jgi:hypothetical protein
VSVNRASKEYKEGVKEFVEFAIAHAKDSNNIICPCLECCYGAVSAEHLQDHLVCNGIDESYTCWTMHGEEETESTGLRSNVRDTSNDYEMVERGKNRKMVERGNNHQILLKG